MIVEHARTPRSYIVRRRGDEDRYVLRAYSLQDALASVRDGLDVEPWEPAVIDTHRVGESAFLNGWPRSFPEIENPDDPRSEWRYRQVPSVDVESMAREIFIRMMASCAPDDPDVIAYQTQYHSTSAEHAFKAAAAFERVASDQRVRRSA